MEPQSAARNTRFENQSATDAFTRSLKSRAVELGFTQAGVCAAVASPGYDRFCDWLSKQYDGEMSYLRKRKAAYEHPQSVLPGVQSILMLAMDYQSANPQTAAPGQGKISQYAWGEVDYHDVIHARLKQLKAFVLEQFPGAGVRGLVDSAPLLEREFAQIAGLGWIGKNTLLLNQRVGSLFFLAALLTDVSLTPDDAQATDHCGTCTACLDACPTDAFPKPYELNAARCISYLTIELRSPLPRELRGGVGDWLFGCDVCQSVCPWNRKAPTTGEESFFPREDSNPVELATLLELSDDEFRQRFRKTPLWRSKRRGIIRNAAIVLGNQKYQPAAGALAKLLGDPEPLIRGACAWALGEMRVASTRGDLEQQLKIETDPDVREELNLALANLK